MYYTKILKRMIILCWIILAVCFSIKLLGGNFFQIVVNSSIYQAICGYIEKHIWTCVLIGSVSTTVLNTLFLLAINRELNFTKKEWILVVISSIIGTIIKLINPRIGLIVDVYQMFMLPFFIKAHYPIRYKIHNVAVGNILVLIFQAVSVFTKNLSTAFATQDLVSGFIWMIDVYIMCTLYYLYSNLTKEEVPMSWFASWLWSKPTSQLEAMKQTRIKKRDKHEDAAAQLNAEIAEIDAVIAEKNNEDKK